MPPLPTEFAALNLVVPGETMTGNGVVLRSMNMLRHACPTALLLTLAAATAACPIAGECSPDRTELPAGQRYQGVDPRDGVVRLLGQHQGQLVWVQTGQSTVANVELTASNDSTVLLVDSCDTDFDCTVPVESSWTTADGKLLENMQLKVAVDSRPRPVVPQTIEGSLAASSLNGKGIAADAILTPDATVIVQLKLSGTADSPTLGDGTMTLFGTGDQITLATLKFTQ
jgi:hypothetical protein